MPQAPELGHEDPGGCPSGDCAEAVPTHPGMQRQAKRRLRCSFWQNSCQPNRSRAGAGTQRAGRAEQTHVHAGPCLARDAYREHFAEAQRPLGRQVTHVACRRRTPRAAGVFSAGQDPPLRPPPTALPGAPKPWPPPWLAQQLPPASSGSPHPVSSCPQ